MKNIITSLIAVALFAPLFASASTVTVDWYATCGTYPTPFTIDPTDPIQVACDLNSDGFINGDDYSIADNAFNTGSPIEIDIPATTTPIRIIISVGGAQAPMSGGSLIIAPGTTLPSTPWSKYLSTYTASGQWVLSPNPAYQG